MQMDQYIKHFLDNNLRNMPGWRTMRKIAVFESGDRRGKLMPSKKDNYKILKAGILPNQLQIFLIQNPDRIKVGLKAGSNWQCRW